MPHVEGEIIFSDVFFAYPKRSESRFGNQTSSFVSWKICSKRYPTGRDDLRQGIRHRAVGVGISTVSVLRF